MHRDERGFGLVEVMVAMMLFAIILVAAAPVIVNSMANSARSLAIANATQFANDQIGLARNAQATCETFQAFLAQNPAKASDGRGGDFIVTAEPASWSAAQVDDCNDPTRARSYPYTVKVARSGKPAEILVETTTLLAVPGVG